MSKRDDLVLLHDIKQAVERILEYTGQMSFEEFQEDYKTQDAVFRNFEIIDEATKNLSSVVRHKAKDIPWKKLAKFRDKLIHHYFGLDVEVVWQIIEEFLPQLNSQIQTAIEHFRKNSRED